MPGNHWCAALGDAAGRRECTSRRGQADGKRAAADAAKSSASDTSTASDADKGPAEKADTATTSETKAGDAKGAADTTAAGVKATEAKGEGAAAAAANPPAAGGVSPWMMGVLIVALFVIPVLLGNYIARAVRMPDYGWKIGLVLFTVAAGAVIVALGEFKFGPDLAGGITLIYEVEDTSVGVVPEPGADAGKGPAADQKGANVAPAPAKKVPMAELISALKQRIDPTGTQEISIRAQGPTAVEIIIPKTGQDALEYVKRRITDLGQLEFRITADPRWPRDRPKIEQAKLAPPNQKDVFLGGHKVAEWVAYDTKEFRKDDDRLVRRMAGDTPEALVLMDPWNVTGDYLSNAAKGADERGGPAVHFSFNSQGAQRFRQLTGQNLRDPATGLYRNLGILLDKRLISAPNIQSTDFRSGPDQRRLDDREGSRLRRQHPERR